MNEVKNAVYFHRKISLNSRWLFWLRFVCSFLVLAMKMININSWKRFNLHRWIATRTVWKTCRKIQLCSFKFIFSLDFNNILSRNPFHQEVLLRNHPRLIKLILLPHYFLMLLPLVALFALKQIIHTKKISFHSTMCIRYAKNSNLLLILNN